MRSSLPVAVCVLFFPFFLAGCGSSNSSGSNQPVPKAPAANAGGPYTGTVGTPVIFTGGGSTDPQGEALTYAWNFGDSSTGTGVSPSHTYAQPGTYSISLMVTDTSGLTGTSTSKATIAAAPPVPNAGGPYTGMVGTAVSFSGAGSSDPQGEALTYAWNFGDGSTGTGPNPSHTYTAPGTYTVMLAVTNTSGLMGGTTSKATIAAAPPLPNAGGPYTGSAGTAVSFSGSGSSDPQGETLTYAWNFGDGSMGTGVSPGHIYSSAGSYTVTLTVTNTSGLTGMATSKATIATATLQPPVAFAGGTFNGYESLYYGTNGLPVSLNGSLSSDPQGEALTYSWNFGDGTTGTGATPNHVFVPISAVYPTVYVVILTVTDTSNLSATAMASVTIYGPPVANAGGPYTGTAGTAVSFNGSASTYDDLRYPSLSYLWNFGDGGTATGEFPTHIYSAQGAYTVTLTVTSGDTLTSTAATAKVAIATAGPGIDGVVYSGLQPVSGAHVYLLAANTTGYGQPSVSLLNGASTGFSDSIGGYVMTGSDGSFVWTGDYSCTPGTQVYLYALGGASGGGAINSASGLMAVLGNCPAVGNLSSVPYIWVNEVSTVAAAYAIAGFATDVTHVSTSGTVLAKVGIANAFANAANLETLSTGVALATTPAGNGTVPLSEINTLASILSGCTGSGSSCSSLLSTATSDGTPTGTRPTETATAAINIAHHPAANVAALYGEASPGNFVPALSVQPSDFTMTLTFTGGGIVSSYGIAIDGQGNVWTYSPSAVSSTVAELSSLGAPISPSTGYKVTGLPTGHTSRGIAIDTSGNVWMLFNEGPSGATPNGGVIELSNSGSLISPTAGYPVGPSGDSLVSLAIDGSGNVWVTDGGQVVELNPSGVAAVPGGYPNAGPSDGVAIDGHGNAWITTGEFGDSLLEVSSSGVVLSPAGGYMGGGLYTPLNVAVDAAGNIWAVTDSLGPAEFSNAGVALSPSTGFTGGGIHFFTDLAIDGSGNVWLSNTPGVAELSNTGVPLSPSSAFAPYLVGATWGIAVDGSGNVWLAGDGEDFELVGAAVPVVTPLSVGVKNNALGTRP